MVKNIYILHVYTKNRFQQLFKAATFYSMSKINSYD